MRYIVLHIVRLGHCAPEGPCLRMFEGIVCMDHVFKVYIFLTFVMFLDGEGCLAQGL